GRLVAAEGVGGKARPGARGARAEERRGLPFADLGAGRSVGESEPELLRAGVLLDDRDARGPSGCGWPAEQLAERLDGGPDVDLNADAGTGGGAGPRSPGGRRIRGAGLVGGHRSSQKQGRCEGEGKGQRGR